MKMLQINITGYQNRKYNVFVVDIEKAKKKLKSKSYVINNIKNIDIILEKTDNSYDIINDDGFLETIYTDKKPGKYTEEDWAFIRMYQRTHGTISIPFEDILGY